MGRWGFFVLITFCHFSYPANVHTEQEAADNTKTVDAGETTFSRLLSCYDSLLDNGLIPEGYGPKGTFLVPPDINLYSGKQGPFFVLSREKGGAVQVQQVTPIDDIALGKTGIVTLPDNKKIYVNRFLGRNERSSTIAAPSFHMRSACANEVPSPDTEKLNIGPLTVDSKEAETQATKLIADLIQSSVGYITFGVVKKVPPVFGANREKILQTLRQCRPVYQNGPPTIRPYLGGLDNAIRNYSDPNNSKFK